MAIDILTWIFAAAFAGTLVILVYFLVAFVKPAMGSAALLFIKAKRKKMPIVALDAGSRWIFKVAEKKAAGFILDDEGAIIEETPKSLKYGGGVLFGVGEYFKSKLVNSTVVDLFAKAQREGWDVETFAKNLAFAVDKIENEREKLRSEKDVRKEKPTENIRTIDLG